VDKAGVILKDEGGVPAIYLEVTIGVTRKQAGIIRRAEREPDTRNERGHKTPQTASYQHGDLVHTVNTAEVLTLKVRSRPGSVKPRYGSVRSAIAPLARHRLNVHPAIVRYEYLTDRIDQFSDRISHILDRL
jgi:hypothetical protein